MPVYKQMLANYEEARQKAVVSWTGAETAYAAVRMLIPSISGQARQYLDFCQKAGFPQDTKKAEREQARNTASIPDPQPPATRTSHPRLSTAQDHH